MWLYLGLFCLMGFQPTRAISTVSCPVAFNAEKYLFKDSNLRLTIEQHKAELSQLATTYTSDDSWPEATVKLGAVGGVSFDSQGNVVIFHRVDRLWRYNTFNEREEYQQRHLGPIRNNTILTLSRDRGQLLHEWGSNLFYMPHGLTVDRDDNVWVTDVALHQVFKFPPRGGDAKPRITLGTAFEPGNSDSNFCKPTAVAVLETGEFFVADGYCNSRILKYSKEGRKLFSWGSRSVKSVSLGLSARDMFYVPHALTLVPEREQICVADREHGLVQCFHWANGTFANQYCSHLIGERIFSVAYTPAEKGQFVVVNGPSFSFGSGPKLHHEVRGFVINGKGAVAAKFGPKGGEFQDPHDLAVTADGRQVFVGDLRGRIYKFDKVAGQ